MSSEWNRHKVYDIIDLISGGTPKTSVPEYWGGNIPWLSVADFNTGYRWVNKADKTITERGVSESSTVVLEKGDLIISARGTVGALAQLTKPMAFNQSCYGIRGKQGISDVDFLYYALRKAVTELKQVAHGGVFDTITRETFKIIELNLPPLSEQRAIAQLLGVLDKRIALIRETNTTLEAIAQALFKSWFVDFDPVRAKQESREPEGMDADTAALFPDSFEMSELGLVPKGWKMVPFGELLCHTTGGDWGSDIPDEKNDTRVAIIRGTDIPDLQTGSNNRVPFRYTSIKKLDTRRLEDGDIVLEISGGSKDQPTGRSLYLTHLLLWQFDCPVEPASFCRLLRPTRKDIGMILGLHLTYIYAQGKTWEYQNQSTGISNFQTVHFLKTEPVILPPDNIISIFVDAIHPLIARTHLTQIKQLAALRDTLLPRLISGQLRIPDAETLIEETTV